MEDIIIRPIATEKTMLQLEKENKIAFIVHRKIRKADVKARMAVCKLPYAEPVS